MSEARAICDGRGNAGTGARACVLYLPEGEIIQQAERLKPVTNIVAEHLAIQLALEVALEANVSRLVVWNDSQTPVRQVQGLYAVKTDHLVPIVERTFELGLLFDSVSIEWVPRERTKVADLLCRHVDPSR